MRPVADEFSESRSDGLSERRLSEVSTSGLKGKQGTSCPYFLLQKYQFFRGSRKRVAFLASDAVL